MLAVLALTASAPSIVTMSNAQTVILAMQRLRADSMCFVDANLVHAAQSPRHGLGLFASAEIRVGDVLSFYPVDSLGKDDEASGLVNIVALAEDMDALEQANASHRLYLLHDDCSGMSVEANPERPSTAGWQAHLINDGAMCVGDGADDVIAYLEASMELENVVLAPFGAAPLVACIAVEPIAAGDELLTTYGPAFWVGGRLSGGAAEAVAQRRQPRLQELEDRVVASARREQAPMLAEASLGFVEAISRVS